MYVLAEAKLWQKGNSADCNEHRTGWKFPTP